MLQTPSRDQERPNWGIVNSLRTGIRDLFPTRGTRTAMWGVVGLAVLITFMELAAAKIFGRLITRLGDLTVLESVLYLGGFVLTFFAIKGIGYGQSVYRLTVFERSLRQLVSTSRAAESWRWPLALTMVSMLEQIARLTIVTVTVAATAWTYGLLLFGCTVAAVAFVNRTGRHQYVIHHEFATAKKAGNPPSAAERIMTRIRAGERVGLVAVGPVLIFIAALGVGAARGQLSAEDALVLFIAARMAANMYGSLANGTMRFIRAQVNVEAYGGTGTVAPADGTEIGPLVSEQDLRTMMADGGYLWEPPGQAFARMIDDGHYLGDMSTLGRVAREAGFGPNGWLRKHAPTTPERLLTVRPRQAWWHRVFLVALASGDVVRLQVAIDVYSRCLVHWRLDPEMSDAIALDFLDEAARVEGISLDEVEVHSTRTLMRRGPTFHDFLVSLGVVRTLIWSSSDGDDTSRPNRPAFPMAFDDGMAVNTWMEEFVRWYNEDFYQPDVGYLHPRDVHAGLAESIMARRQGTLDSALPSSNPFHAGVPDEWLPPIEATLQPTTITTTAQDVQAAEGRMLDDDDEEL